MGDYGASTVSTASQVGSTAGEVASTASSTGGMAANTMGTVGEVAGNAGSSTSGLSEAGGLLQHSGYEATAPGQGGYFVSSGVEGTEAPTSFMQNLNNIYEGSQGSLGDAIGWARNGEWGKVAGYGVGKVGNTVMDMGKGGGGQGSAPVTINAQQPNPDNSYLQRLRRLSRGY